MKCSWTFQCRLLCDGSPLTANKWQHGPDLDSFKQKNKLVGFIKKGRMRYRCRRAWYSWQCRATVIRSAGSSSASRFESNKTMSTIKSIASSLFLMSGCSDWQNLKIGPLAKLISLIGTIIFGKTVCVYVIGKNPYSEHDRCSCISNSIN